MSKEGWHSTFVFLFGEGLDVFWDDQYSAVYVQDHSEHGTGSLPCQVLFGKLSIVCLSFTEQLFE